MKKKLANKILRPSNLNSASSKTAKFLFPHQNCETFSAIIGDIEIICYDKNDWEDFDTRSDEYAIQKQKFRKLIKEYWPRLKSILKDYSSNNGISKDE